MVSGHGSSHQDPDHEHLALDFRLAGETAANGRPANPPRQTAYDLMDGMEFEPDVRPIDHLSD